MSAAKKRRAPLDDATLPPDTAAVLKEGHHERQARYEDAQEAYYKAHLDAVRAMRRSRIASAEGNCAYIALMDVYKELDGVPAGGRPPRELERRLRDARTRYDVADRERARAQEAEDRAMSLERRVSDEWTNFLSAYRSELEKGGS